MKRIGITIFLVGAMTIPAFGAPYSRMGLVNIPTADILEHAALDVVLTGSIYNYQGTIGTPGLEEEGDCTLNFGMYNKFEVGLTQLTLSNAPVLNFQWRILREKSNAPAVSIGLQNIMGAPGISDIGSLDTSGGRSYYEQVTGLPEANSFYIVASKDLPFLRDWQIRVHLGWGTGRFQGRYEVKELFGLKSYGIFGAIHIRPNKYADITIEEDGRNLNIGYELKLIDTPLAFKMEFLRYASLLIAIEEAEWLWRGIFGGYALNYNDYTQTKYGIALKYELPPLNLLFKRAGRAREKKTLMMETMEKKRKISMGEDELEKIRKKRKQIEADIERMKKILLEE